MVLERPGSGLLRLATRLRPEPKPGEVLVEVSAYGVCRTDLHVVNGGLKDPKQPIVPGHEIVGRVAATGEGVEQFQAGDRVGVPWLGYTCGVCDFCRDGRENLCPSAQFTGYQIDGGYAEYCLVDRRYFFPIAGAYSDAEVAPLLCAGLIGHRSLRVAGDPRRLGIFGFGAAAHIVAQVACWEGREVFAIVRPGDDAAKEFARDLGAVWAGDSGEAASEPLDAAIIFAPVGSLVPIALRAVMPAGIVVCAGIHMSDISAFPYEILWEERQIRSVANLTLRDGEEFLKLAPKVPVKTSVSLYGLEEANDALSDLREGRLQGAAVLTMGCGPAR